VPFCTAWKNSHKSRRRRRKKKERGGKEKEEVKGRKRGRTEEKVFFSYMENKYLFIERYIKRSIQFTISFFFF
jgi:hypothetical protein